MKKTSHLIKIQKLSARICRCDLCPLGKTRTLAVPGTGGFRSKVMMIGEAPGKAEDLSGLPFVGAAGKVLTRMIEESGFTRDDFFITSSVKCRPPKNRVPRPHEISTCKSNYLMKQIEILQPKLIVLLGGVAAKNMLQEKNVTLIRGQIVEREGLKYFITYHPAVQFYNPKLAVKIKEDFILIKKLLKKL